jgi:hypothetical protein
MHAVRASKRASEDEGIEGGRLCMSLDAGVTQACTSVPCWQCSKLCCSHICWRASASNIRPSMCNDTSIVHHSWHRAMARKYHPDKNPAGRPMFMRVQQAYERLQAGAAGGQGPQVRGGAPGVTQPMHPGIWSAGVLLCLVCEHRVCLAYLICDSVTLLLAAAVL